jgi:hypothetical protein
MWRVQARHQTVCPRCRGYIKLGAWILEPEVLVLLDDIRTERPHENNYFQIWYGYKERLSELVGWCREASANPELRSSVAYNIVYYKLLENLNVPE